MLHHPTRSTGFAATDIILPMRTSITYVVAFRPNHHRANLLPHETVDNIGHIFHKVRAVSPILKTKHAEEMVSTNIQHRKIQLLSGSRAAATRDAPKAFTTSQATKGRTAPAIVWIRLVRINRAYWNAPQV